MTSTATEAPDPGRTMRTFRIANAVITVVVLAFLVWVVYFQGGMPGEAAMSRTLPAVNAGLNATSALLIIAGRIAIRLRKRTLHAAIMIAAVLTSAAFVASYVWYHMHHGDTLYTGTGWIRPVYFTVLISHILLSAVAFPMILASLFLAVTNRFAKHRRLSRWTWAAWLYVSVTGVAIYFFLY